MASIKFERVLGKIENLESFFIDINKLICGGNFRQLVKNILLC